MIATRSITGGGGIALNLASTGPETAPPILLVHGFLHSIACWAKQLSGPLSREFRLHALDMRGHGASDKPADREAYRDGALWAQDMAAAVEACGAPPVVVVWSYPGLMLGDYLRRFGSAALAGVVMVAALTGIGLTRPPTREDSPSPLFADDPELAGPAMRGFIARCTAVERSDAELDAVTEEALATTRAARLGMNMRQEDFLPDYAKLDRPALVIWGEADTIVARAEAEGAAAAIPDARLSLYEGIGHMPFAEAPARFDAELAAFARTARGGRT